MIPTKKAFREHLNNENLKHLEYLKAKENSQFGPYGRHKNGRFHQRKRLYGDYLYAQDREGFNFYYAEWLKEQGFVVAA